MAKKKYSITAAGGGSTYTRYRIDVLDHMDRFQSVPSSFMITMQRDRKQLQKHVRSI